MNMTLLTTFCVHMDGKVSIVFNRNCFPKITDSARLGALQAVTYPVKMVVSKKWCEIDTLLLIGGIMWPIYLCHIQWPYPWMTLNAIQPNAGLIKCNSTNICVTFSSVFTARCYASAVPAMVCVCLGLSVTSRSFTKTAKRRITQTTSHDTPGSLVFWCQRSPRNSTGVTPYGGAECRWGASKSATVDR